MESVKNRMLIKSIKYIYSVLTNNAAPQQGSVRDQVVKIMDALHEEDDPDLNEAFQQL